MQTKQKQKKHKHKKKFQYCSLKPIMLDVKKSVIEFQNVNFKISPDSF
jgi:hypothetical protein